MKRVIASKLLNYAGVDASDIRDYVREYCKDHGVKVKLSIEQKRRQPDRIVYYVYFDDTKVLEVLDDDNSILVHNEIDQLLYQYTHKDEDPPITVRFKVGSTYTASMLYGGIATYKCVDRTKDTATFSCFHISEDDGRTVDDGPEEYSIVIQDMYDDNYDEVIGKQESVEIWNYHGHVGYLYAK